MLAKYLLIFIIFLYLVLVASKHLKTKVVSLSGMCVIVCCIKKSGYSAWDSPNILHILLACILCQCIKW